MFDIGFLEIIIIAVIALLVLGPERMPGAVRTVSLQLGRLRRSFNALRQEIEREVGADEIRRELHNQSILDMEKTLNEDLNKARRQIEDLPYDVQDVVESTHAASSGTPNTEPAAAEQKAPQENEPSKTATSSSESKQT